jgi:uncharacterized membrane protein
MDFLNWILFCIMVVGCIASTIWFVTRDSQKNHNAEWLGLLCISISQYVLLSAFWRYYQTHGYSETMDKMSGDIVNWALGAIIFSIIGFALFYLAIKTQTDDETLTTQLKSNRSKKNKKKNQKLKGKKNGQKHPKTSKK